MDDFFSQHPTSIDVSHVNWDILGLREVLVPSGKMEMKHFEVQKSVGISELIAAIRNRDDSIDFGVLYSLQSNAIKTISEIKEDAVISAIEDIRQKIVAEFSEDIKSLSGNVVQFVEKPLCFLDLAPGDVSITFNLMTKRVLGVLDE